MMIKIHSRGRGRGSGPVDYLLGRNRDREGAKVLHGHTDTTEQLINSSPYAQRYTSGVLSFAEADLPDGQKQQIMESFEDALLPGLDRDQYQCLWVEHRDKGRLELNFLVPNIELTSGKRLQPYYDRADRPRLNAWKQITNIEYGLHDPDDPINKRDLVTANDLPRHKQQAKEIITQGLAQLVEAGEIRNRDDIIKTLENSGFNVVRQTKQSISIADPDGGRNLRLKGVLYEQAFRPSENLRDQLESASRSYRESTSERLREAREHYQRCVKRKSAENQKRHQRPQPEHTRDDAQALVMAAVERDNTLDSPASHPLVAGGKDRSELASDRQTEQPARSTSQARGQNPDQHLREQKPVLHQGGSQSGDVRQEQRVDDSRRLLNDKPSPKTPQKTHTTRRKQPENDHDGIRESLAKRLRATLERARKASQRIAERTSQFTANVRNYFARERTVTDASRSLEQSSQHLERATPAIERVIQQEQTLARTRRRERSRGQGLSR